MPISFNKINGSAGTGKTTHLINLVKLIIEEQKESVMLICPTNKAAAVLNSKLRAAGLTPNAGTLHSQLYDVSERSTGKYEKVPAVDPKTWSYLRDKSGAIITMDKEITVPYYGYLNYKIVRENIKWVLVDESSMVPAAVWCDLLEKTSIPTDYTLAIVAFGDEKQLPPIEDNRNMTKETVKYIQFWHNSPANETLVINHRQSGPLKTMVDECNNALFAYNAATPQLPVMTTGVAGDYSFVLDINQGSQEDISKLISDASIIITPTNAIRECTNVICRKLIAQKANLPYDILPVVGDKIIFKSQVAQGTEMVAKNTYGTIETIHDIDTTTFNVMTCDIRDENDKLHPRLMVGLYLFTNTNSSKPTPKKSVDIDFAYAVTVHSAQGGEWNDVLFLNGWWMGDGQMASDEQRLDTARLRYTAITRAASQLWVFNNVSVDIGKKDYKKINVYSKLIKLNNACNEAIKSGSGRVDRVGNYGAGELKWL